MNTKSVTFTCSSAASSVPESLRCQLVWNERPVASAHVKFRCAWLCVRGGVGIKSLLYSEDQRCSIPPPSLVTFASVWCEWNSSFILPSLRAVLRTAPAFLGTCTSLVLSCVSCFSLLHVGRAEAMPRLRHDAYSDGVQAVLCGAIAEAHSGTGRTLTVAKSALSQECTTLMMRARLHALLNIRV